MTTCNRFEREGLLRLERGLPLGEHFESCPDCRRAQGAYRRLESGLGDLGAGYRPPGHWQARTWAAIARRSQRRRRRLWVLVPAGVAALLALVWIPLGPRQSLAPSLAVTVEPAPDVVRRGAEAARGDRLVLRAATGGAPHAELRVYLDDADLVLCCADAPPCRRRGQRLEAALELTAVGTYQSLLFLSEVPLPVPLGAGLDADAGAALDAGARVELGEAIRVR